MTDLQSGSPVDDVDGPVVLFDGVCNFCAWSVRFIHAHDDGALRFAPLQSGVGTDLLAEHGMATDYFDSLVYIGADGVYTRSAGAVRIARHLDYPYRLAWLLRLVPEAVRDAGYDLFARIRYDVFGRKESCMVPDAELRERFLATGDDAVGSGERVDAASPAPAAQTE
ncbi:thiol-disulfide oxidoreductase DCC family protein [Haloglomus irregulare]|jgi:predicted DCC family thiol-disulfide oxidoreductase YuxK|uniref:Thiol-disulfide oxidoreductase DCC family protein n=1 Tax=Haloglomus irregulare TaxID=2234134 RepID=A0A554N923_9EURY|nr:DCC1-like thiol-disulfide oxidoreductase family protein [Haloglomus irregulare]TSD13871.1 thiol-disulfide oxidoreductase DCC family protein [Haloglomus irregulare]